MAAPLGVAKRLSPDYTAVAEELAGPAGLTARASTFTRRDVIQAWCQRLPAGAAVEEIERFADATLDARAGIAVPLVGRDRPETQEVVERAASEVVSAVASRLDP